MTVRKRDFQRIVHEVKDFITKLKGNETTAELRDSLNFSLLLLHKYYKRLRNKSKKLPLLDGSISLSSSLGSISPASPYIPPQDKFEWRWLNLDPSKLNASFGHGDSSNLLPEIFYVLKDADVDRLKELIKKDSDCVNELDPLGRSTALYCVHGNTDEHLECLDILIENAIDLNQESNDGATCLHIAALQDSKQMVDEVLTVSKELINAEDNEGRYPLHFAAGYSCTSVVQTLISAGADKNCLDNNELTPVMWACHFDMYENVELLLQIKADDEMRFERIDLELKDVDSKGQCLLHWSVSRSINKSCFQILFNEQYMDVVDNDGKTVLHAIAENGVSKAAEEYFTMCGNEDIDVLDKHKRSALHYACMFGHGEMVDILLSKGASLDLLDKNGMSSYEYAKSKNLHYCMLVIQSYEKYRRTTDKLEIVINNIPHNNNDSKIPPTQNSSSKTHDDDLVIELREKSKAIKNHHEIPSLKVITPKPATSNPDSLLSPKETEVSDFDTLQNEEAIVKKRRESIEAKKKSKNETKQEEIESESNSRNSNPSVKSDNVSIVDDVDDDVNINLNDQMIVLVEHHGSDDDEIVFNVNNNDSLEYDEKKSSDSTIFRTQNRNGEERKISKTLQGKKAEKKLKNKMQENLSGIYVSSDDEQDSMPFARNENLTTALGGEGDISTGFNSISVNPSVNSVFSEDESDGEHVHVSQNIKPLKNKSRIKKQADKLTNHDKQPDTLTNHKSAISINSDSDNEDFPPFALSANQNDYSSIIAPMPPPPSANYQLPLKNPKQPDINQLPVNFGHHEKRSKSLSSSLKSENPPSLSNDRSSKKSSKGLGQSWPSMKKTDSITSPNLTPVLPIRSAGVKLAPISTKVKPKPPKLK